MNNLSSYFEIIAARMSASDQDLHNYTNVTFFLLDKTITKMKILRFVKTCDEHVQILEIDH